MTKAEAAKAWCESRVGCPYLMGGTGQVCTPAYRQARMTQYPEYAAKMKTNCPRLNSGKTSCDGCRWADPATGKGRRAYDCAQLCRWCMNSVGISLVSGANSQWNQTAWVAKGTIDQMPRDRVCCVYRWDEDKHRMGHAGMYQGDGFVIHAKGHDYGVVKERIDNTDFTHYGIPEGLYEGEYDPPILRKGDQSQAVERMQQLLVAAGYTLKATKSAANGCDGIFGSDTNAALLAFQADHGLNPTGICERVTWAALMGEQTPGSAQASPPTEPETPEPEAPDISPLDDPEYVRIKKAAMAEILDMFEKITRMLEEALE